MALDKADSAASVHSREVKIANLAGQSLSAAERTFFLSRNEFAGSLPRTMVLREQPPFRSSNLVLFLLLILFASGDHDYLANGIRHAAQPPRIVLKVGP
jgi:hypothetical protein